MSHDGYNTVGKVIKKHCFFGILPFHVEKAEDEDNSYHSPVQELKHSGCAEVGLEQVGPRCSQQPEDGEGYGAVDAEREEEAVGENHTGDGAELVEEVDGRGEARGHVLDLRKRPAEAASVVHQGPGHVTEREGHREN